MLTTSKPTKLVDLVDLDEGRRRLIEATREASRWRPTRRRRIAVAK